MAKRQRQDGFGADQAELGRQFAADSAGRLVEVFNNASRYQLWWQAPSVRLSYTSLAVNPAGRIVAANVAYQDKPQFLPSPINGGHVLVACICAVARADVHGKAAVSLPHDYSKMCLEATRLPHM